MPVSLRHRNAGVTLGLSLLLVFGCGAESDDGPAGDAAPAVSAGTETEPVVPGQPDAALAARGETLFTQKACGTCHTIGDGRLVGPDLLGVTGRRSEDWIMAMILNPDSMLRTDSIARRLFSEYFTPMVNQNLSHDEAAALYNYLLRADADSTTSGN